jgi:hypothetical protein
MQVERASGDGLPTLHMDHFYLSSADAEEEGVMPHLVVRCDKTRRTWATALPQKGTHAFNVSWLCSIVREAGWMEEDDLVLRQRASNESSETGRCRSYERP